MVCFGCDCNSFISDEMCLSVQTVLPVMMYVCMYVCTLRIAKKI